MTKTKVPWWDKAFRFFYPWGGPCQLGPYGEPELPPASGKACPMCTQVMSSHRIERREGHSTKLHCPPPSALAAVTNAQGPEAA